MTGPEIELIPEHTRDPARTIPQPLETTRPAALQSLLDALLTEAGGKGKWRKSKQRREGVSE